jgi:hypothetical protein
MRSTSDFRRQLIPEGIHVASLLHPDLEPWASGSKLDLVPIGGLRSKLELRVQRNGACG